MCIEVEAVYHFFLWKIIKRWKSDWANKRAQKIALGAMRRGNRRFCNIPLLNLLWKAPNGLYPAHGQNRTLPADPRTPAFDFDENLSPLRTLKDGSFWECKFFWNFIEFLLIFGGRFKFLSARVEILKRVLGRSGGVSKYRGRVNFPIFSFKTFPWNFKKFLNFWKKIRARGTKKKLNTF